MKKTQQQLANEIKAAQQAEQTEQMSQSQQQQAFNQTIMNKTKEKTIELGTTYNDGYTIGYNDGLLMKNQIGCQEVCCIQRREFNFSECKDNQCYMDEIHDTNNPQCDHFKPTNSEKCKCKEIQHGDIRGREMNPDCLVHYPKPTNIARSCGVPDCTWCIPKPTNIEKLEEMIKKGECDCPQCEADEKLMDKINDIIRNQNKILDVLNSIKKG